MDFDHSREIITPDITNVLTIGGYALELPTGTTNNRPQDAAIGAIRYNTTSKRLEFLGEIEWEPVTTTTTVNVAAGVGALRSASLTTTTTAANQVLDSLPIAQYRSAVYQIQVTANGQFQSTSVHVLHDGTDVYTNEINTITSQGGNLAVFTAVINNGNMELLTTPAFAATVIKALVTVITI